MTTVKMPKMERTDVERLIEEQLLCRIAFKGDEYPYMAPFQYVFIDGFLYFHFTDYGKKMRLLEKDNRVCVEIESYKKDLSEYSFVVLRGTLKLVTDPEERSKVINKMAEEGRRKLSKNFLVAHGFRRDETWSSLTPEKPLVVVKLDKIAEQIGLKSF